MVISMDSFFKPDEDRNTVSAPIQPDKRYRDDNHPTSFDLQALKTHIRTLAKQQKFQVIIVEGLFALQEEGLFELLDLKLFIDCQADERIVRRIKRNMEWGLSYDEITSIYLDLVRYRHDEFVQPYKWRADMIINGAGDSKKVLSMLKTYILQCCEE